MAISTDHSVGTEDQRFACSCLNIRIQASTSSKPATTITPKDNSTEYTPVFTTEKGISMTHSALTLRFRTKGSALTPQTWGQYIALRCLVCDLVVYRVYQEVPMSMAGREGPIRPKEDWIEDEVLFSSTGWIELSRKCLSGKELTKLETSSQISSLYHIVMPSSSSSSASQEPHPALDPPLPTQYFAHLQPLIALTPFTPNHVVFSRISEVAQEKSDDIRLAAEKEIVDMVQQKSQEIVKKETALREEVHTLWARYRDSMQKILAAQREAIIPRSPISPSGDGISRNLDAAATSVRNFTPSKVSPRTSSATPPAPRMSSLSASLATSTFHHPKAHEEAKGSPSPSTTASSPVISNTTPSTGGEPSLLSYKRVKDETSDAATSYRYWVNMEEEMARHKGGRQQETTQDRVATIHEESVSTPSKPLSVQTPLAANGNNKANVSQPPPDSSKPDTPTKGKRKVTFEVKESTVDDNDSQQVAAASTGELEESDDMMFPIEEDDESGDVPVSSEATRLPFLEQGSQLPRSMRGYPRRHFDTTGLPASFSGLRPTSLPMISQIRKPPSVRNTVASLVLPPLDAALEPEEDGGGQDAENSVMRLVAAGTPSHRAAWKKHGPAWKRFMQKPANDSEETDTDSDEVDRIGELQGRWRGGDAGMAETEPDISKVGIPGSLAIPAHHHVRQPVKELTQEDALMASYRPANALQGQTDRQSPASFTGHRVQPSLDLSRLGFPPANGAAVRTDEEEEEEELATNTNDVERGRKHALKIIEARSKLPEAGMWRSLA